MFYNKNYMLIVLIKFVDHSGGVGNSSWRGEIPVRPPLCINPCVHGLQSIGMANKNTVFVTLVGLAN